MMKKHQKLNFGKDKIPKGEIERRVKEALKRKEERQSKQSEELRSYLRKVNKTPCMNLEEENTLWKEIKGKKGDQKAQEKIIRANLNLVVSVARQYRDNCYLTFLELIKEGEKGIRKAMKSLRWEWRAGDRFATRAGWWVRSAVVNAIAHERRKILEQGDIRISIWKDKKGHITNITFSGFKDRLHVSGEFEGTNKEKQKYAHKIEEEWKDLTEVEERLRREVVGQR